MRNVFMNVLSFITAMVSKTRYGFALIQLGGGVSDVRGSIGGTTFARNRYGNYARNKTVPVDPASSYQTAIRATMGQVRSLWFNSCTAAQRTAWGVYATNVSMVNRIGQSIKLTGYNMFCRTNTSLLYNSLDPILDAPTDFSLAEQDATLAVTCSAATQNLSVAFDTDLDWVDEDDAHLLIYASRPMNPTINFFKGPYRLAGSVAGDATTAPTSPQTIAVPFAVVAGQKVFVQARIVRADGRMSEPFRVSCTVAA